MLRFFQYHFNLKVGVVVVAAGVTKISSSFSYNTQVLAGIEAENVSCCYCRKHL